MPRVVTASLQTELSKPVTRIGYLVMLNNLGDPPVTTVRWCNVSEDGVTWPAIGEPGSAVWADYSFEVQGLGAGKTATLTVQNVDDAMAALLLASTLSGVTCDLYQCAPAAVAVAEDVVYLGKYMMDSCEIEVDKATIGLVLQASLDYYSPRRRVTPYHGFNFALQEGAKITWGTEVYVVGKTVAAPTSTKPATRGGRRG